MAVAFELVERRKPGLNPVGPLAPLALLAALLPVAAIKLFGGAADEPGVAFDGAVCPAAFNISSNKVDPSDWQSAEVGIAPCSFSMVSIKVNNREAI